MAENDNAPAVATRDEAAPAAGGDALARRFLVRVEALARGKPSTFESWTSYISREMTFGPFPLGEALDCLARAETAELEGDEDEIRGGLVPV